MRLDTANRSFTGLVGASAVAGMVLLCGAAGCVLAALVASQVGRHGLDAFAREPESLWPAAAFLAIVGTGAAIGARSLVRQVRDSRELDRRVRELTVPSPPDLVAAAERARVGDVVLVDAAEAFSFAYGAVVPRVAISRGLVDSVSAAELEAVLAHERYHVRNLDPLKVLIARALPAVFFYLPALKVLRERYVAGRELAADRRAVRRCGREPLAGALLKVVRGPAWPELRTAAAIGGPDLLEVRLAQLETGSEPRLSLLTPRSVVASLAGALLLTGLLVAAVAGFGGVGPVADATGSDLRASDLVGAAACVVIWGGLIWLGSRWLARPRRGHG